MKLDILEQEKLMPKFISTLISCSPPTRDEINMLKENADNLGLPNFTAPYDAEIYASKLCEKIFYQQYGLQIQIHMPLVLQLRLRDFQVNHQKKVFLLMQY